MTISDNVIDYSIVICTYNPDERLLQRCLRAVLNLNRTGITTEVIVVDNNSQVPVETLLYVREYLSKIPSMKIILVVKQGVKYARMAAIEKSAGNHIVYFDYDNEPESDYLQELKKINAQHPQVGAIGPGNVSVDFIDGIDKKIESYARIAFQQKHTDVMKFSGIKEWQDCYPFGTGLCTQSFLLKEYVAMAKQEKFTMPGRTANRLTSGEDTQMVLYCLSKGYFAGVAPSLKLTHIIPQQRANVTYLKRLAYGTALCYQSCVTEIFTEHKIKLQQEIISAAKFSRQALKKYIQAKLSADQNKLFNLINFIAVNSGVYLALQKDIPPVVKQITGNLKLD